MHNKAGNSRVVKHQELLTNSDEKPAKEECEFEERMISTEFQGAVMIMSTTFCLAFGMRNEAPSLLMVTLVLAFITSSASALIFSVIIASGVTKGTMKKLPMRCGVMIIRFTFALLLFAIGVKFFQNRKGTVG